MGNTYVDVWNVGNTTIMTRGGMLVPGALAQMTKSEFRHYKTNNLSLSPPGPVALTKDSSVINHPTVLATPELKKQEPKKPRRKSSTKGG